MFNRDDVYVKTELGSKEISNSSQSILPREARNLLILLDGNKSYSDVEKLLENRSMYKSAGGVFQYMELLIDLEYVSTKASSFTSKVFSASFNKQASDTHNSDSAISENELSRDEPRVVKAENSQTPDTNSAGQRKIKKSTFDQLQSKAAALIEKTLADQQSWPLLIELERCQSTVDIYQLLWEKNKQLGGKFSKLASKLLAYMEQNGLNK